MKQGAKWFWVIVAAQLVFLLAWAGYHEWVRSGAQVIVLKCQPVDPQDLLRGDYMTLRYDISDAKVEGVEAPKKTGQRGAEVGRDVWVLLEPRGRYHSVVRASVNPLTPVAGQLVVRGKVGYSWRASAGQSAVDYGIERYFVPEGKGTPRFRLMEVEAAVSSDHRLYIKRVLLDGHAYP